MRFLVILVFILAEILPKEFNSTMLIVSIKKSILTIGIVVTTMLLLTQKWLFCFIKFYLSKKSHLTSSKSI